MGDSTAELSSAQDIVHLDVSGTRFRILRGTIERYPDSLLAKMIKEFPALVEAGQPLFIDRSPKAFEWIREIYRNGDFMAVTPGMSDSSLQTELDFSQLPSLQDLTTTEMNMLQLTEKELLPSGLMRRILHEIGTCGLSKSSPWSVLIYDKVISGKWIDGPSIFVLPPYEIDTMEYIAKRGHDGFFRAISGIPAFNPRKELSNKVKVRGRTDQSECAVYAVFLYPNNVFLPLREAAAVYGLKIMYGVDGIPQNHAHSVKLQALTLLYE